jgi:tRNA(fMet)-specific endonuclease VapC
MYLLDTCAVSDFVKGDENTLKKIKSLSPSLLYISSINYMEISYGLQRNPQKARQIAPILEDFFQLIHIVNFTQKDAEKAVQIRFDLQIKGTPIGPYDVLIAGVALSRDLILVTSNTDEFKRITELKIENWRYTSRR